MSKIRKGEWVIVFVVAGTIDVIQWILDLVIGPGEIANEIADTIIGCIFAVYFQIRGVSLTKHPSRLLSLVGGVVAEMLTVSIAPAWIIDVWYIHRTVQQEDAVIQATQSQEKLLQNVPSQPLNQDGVRSPVTDTVQQPVNRNGVRSAGNMQPLASIKNVRSGIDGIQPPQQN